ncbi:hypothetical protein ACRCQA_31955, partial [Pseudomonas aeruginosa]
LSFELGGKRTSLLAHQTPLSRRGFSPKSVSGISRPLHDVFLAAVNKAFEFLPMPVRLILPRAALERHSLTQRDAIVKLLAEKKATRDASEGTPLNSQDI